MDVRVPPLPTVSDGSSLGPIPRLLHQVWVGPADPSRANRVFDLWRERLGPDWDAMLWTEQSMQGTPLGTYAPLIDAVSDDPRLRADLYRLVAVAFYGGVYADSDAVPLQPLDEWVGERNGWVGSGPETRDSPTLINAVFGMPSRHPFLGRVMVLALEALRRGVTDPHYVAGPRQFRTAYRFRPDVDVSYDFVTTLDPTCRAMVRGDRPIDLDWMRERFPSSPVLHVVLR